MEMSKHVSCRLLLLLFIAFGRACGHGRLWDPPSRSTMWRLGFNTPRNTNDHELNCGGYVNQWFRLQGRCGICGDPYKATPRPNEAGGVFANGIITKQYRVGDVIQVTVDLTANHMGYFEFHLCPNNNVKQPITQECLDRYPLTVVGQGRRYYVHQQDYGLTKLSLQLPAIMCSQCVLQWKYNTGTRWGCDKEETCGNGFGPQEEFYGCSDIALTMHNTNEPVQRSWNTPNMRVSNRGIQQHKNVAAIKVNNVKRVILLNQNKGVSPRISPRRIVIQRPSARHGPIMRGRKVIRVPDLVWWRVVMPRSRDKAITVSRGTPMVIKRRGGQVQILPNVGSSDLTLRIKQTNCRGTGAYINVVGISQWCDSNCASGNCPDDVCNCGQNEANLDDVLDGEDNFEDGGGDGDDRFCHGTKLYSHRRDIDKWCQANCSFGHCPPRMCSCV